MLSGCGLLISNLDEDITFDWRIMSFKYMNIYAQFYDVFIV